ncbi:rhamnosyltransferase WsaF family glycosyltransferase [Paraburkholderia sediminicola]|uniref:rhamnosyltransferase WsaF family glycosyltransferase n=1 Tax=Paraburkholderia sediminicola TaxID=458836 RepID=UPI0038B92EF5
MVKRFLAKFSLTGLFRTLRIFWRWRFFLARSQGPAASALSRGKLGAKVLVYAVVGERSGFDLCPLFNARWYLRSNLDVANQGANPLAHFLARGAGEGRNPNPLFDSAWYLAQNPDVAATGINPLEHYLMRGSSEGRNPHPLFDSTWYLQRNPDVVAAGINPLEHYLMRGGSEGRSPHPMFDSTRYMQRNPDIAAAGINPLEHYLTRGGREGRDPHPLFHSAWYLAQNPDVAATGINPFEHYLMRGGREGRSPHPLFDSAWYLAQNADVAVAGINPLEHYLMRGGSEGRSPHPLFDSTWYMQRNPDVVEAGINPLEHYLMCGGSEGRSPHPLFDSAWYLAQNPDVTATGINPLEHYLMHGGSEGRSPHPVFDGAWYLQRNRDVAAAGVNPLVHYVQCGASERRNPSAGFNTKAYLARNPDVAAAGINPLVHYVLNGMSKDNFHDSLDGAIARYEEHGAVGAETILRLGRDGLDNIFSFIAPHHPLNVFVDPSRSSTPTLQILLPSLRARHATGGPNTAYILGLQLANEGIPVGFIATDGPLDDDLDWIKDHVRGLTGLDPDELGVEFRDASDRNQSLGLGYNDVLFATAWWTAQVARSVTSMLRRKRIYYLIQDYETLFYGTSENFADAEATYGFDHLPVINSKFLRDHLVERAIGRYANPGFGSDALVFDPAIDQSRFYPQDRFVGMPRRVLFYARPTVAMRNLFPLGVATLRAAVEKGLFGDGGWEFVGMGEQFEPVPLGRGYTLTPAPWVGFDAYAEQVRSADIMLSLMLSPHPSYPPLEMAACGGVAVTTVFGSKTATRLADFSANLIGADPEIGDLLTALTRARALSDDRGRRQTVSPLQLPGSWREALAPVVEKLVTELRGDGIVPRTVLPQLASAVSVVRANEETERSPAYYCQRAKARRTEYVEGETSGLLSLITTVYDTDPSFLTDLAHTVFGQDTMLDFEWVVLDNGSTRPDTLDVLTEIARDPRVRLARVDKNLGIIGGMRWCLGHARGRYVVPVDSDDLLFPDCIRTISSFLEKAGFPLISYTDEDKTDGPNHRDCYIKPDWDPVLFIHSCYIAHLTVIDREAALALGCYSDPAVEGCHDWDTFIRFLSAGHRPAHIPEVLYSWRMHEASTSGNFRSKPYIYASHKAALERFLAARGKLDKYEIALSPLFGGTPDYTFKLRGSDLDDLPAVASQNDGGSFKKTNQSLIGTVSLGQTVSRADLIRALSQLDSNARYVHLSDLSCGFDDGFVEEALTHFDLFPDTVVVGGRIHDSGILREGGYVFGYAGAIGCPDAGQPLTNPGYFAQAWKPRSVAAVSARHCIVDRAFLMESAAQLPSELRLAMLGPWLGALARTKGQRVIYTPLITAQLKEGADVTASRADLAAYNATFGGLRQDPVGYARHLDRSGQRPYQPEEATSPLIRLPYEDYLARHIEQRLTKLAPQLAVGCSTISVLTTVYERTDTQLFCLTAEAMRSQRHRASEWLVLAHGPIPRELDDVLIACETEGLLRILRHDVNLGIHGGLRYCLELATGDFALSLDADDLLTPDALAVLAVAAKDNPKTDIFYSDEDLLIEGAYRHPFYRPDYDPVLIAAQSYVWHAILFRRQVGLSLGAFTSGEAEYAQDWDILVRFAKDGHLPRHVPEVLYHWRQHARSLSNSGSTFSGSSMSVQAVLREIARQHPADLYEVAPYPFDLGIPDFYLKRLRKEPPTIVKVSMGLDASGLVDFPFNGRVTVSALRGRQGISVLLDVLEQSDSEFAMLVGPATLAIENQSVWDAIKHFELVPEVVAVGGPLVNSSGRIVRGAVVLSDNATLVDSTAGRAMTDPCAGSLGLKPHCVNGLSPDLLIARRDFLLAALKAAPDGLTMRSLGAWLGAYAVRVDRLLAYEPLLRGFVKNETDLVGDGVSGLQTSWTYLVAPLASGGAPIRGLAEFVRHADLHE